jgi:hypothetical protein
VIKKERVMLIVSLLVSIQHSVVRFKTRKKMALLTAQQRMDIGLTVERQQAEISRATWLGFLKDLRLTIKEKGRSL